MKDDWRATRGRADIQFAAEPRFSRCQDRFEAVFGKRFGRPEPPMSVSKIEDLEPFCHPSLSDLDLEDTVDFDGDPKGQGRAGDG